MRSQKTFGRPKTSDLFGDFRIGCTSFHRAGGRRNLVNRGVHGGATAPMALAAVRGG